MPFVPFLLELLALRRLTAAAFATLMALEPACALIVGLALLGQIPDVTGLLGREWAGRNVTSSLELADLILDAAEVAVVPGEAFGPSGYLRLSYALGDDQLLEGVQRLQRLFG